MHIICHMMSTVDGRIIGNRWTRPHQADYDTVIQCYFDISNSMKADAILLGRTTVQVDLIPETFSHYGPTVQDISPYMGARSKRFCIVMDTHGKIAYTSNQIMGDTVFAILGPTVSEVYVSKLRQLGISYCFLKNNDLKGLLKTLNEMGIHKILVEGGGYLNASFLKAGLIDELSLLIYPGIDGQSGIPAVFEFMGENPSLGQSLELIDVNRQPYGVVWLRYKIHR